MDMATASSLLTAAQEGQIPTSIQPGGGWCMSLELAWARWRRRYLRLVRRGYVRRMAEKRQGQCENCPHDIIDSRDLKYFHNVCGYWFRPEDDAFRWRNRVGLARAGFIEMLLVSLTGFILIGALAAGAIWCHPLISLPIPIIALLWFQLIFFFRDPERIIPSDPAVLVSPADGTVTHVGEVEEPDFPGGRAFRISIFLSVFNVHVNRMPRAAQVMRARYFPGAFLDARHPECGTRNEQLWLDLQEPETGRPLRVKQIAGKIARRIVCWVKAGDTLQTGERFGLIKFGSRTEVCLPVGEAIEVATRVGDKVKGGATVLLRFKGA